MASSNIWKFLLVIGILLSLVAFILGWIGFGVPDWHAFQRYNGSTTEYYGLWAYCQDPIGTSGTVCKRWPTAEDQLFNGSRPSFIRAAEGLITTGMILLSLGLFASILALLLPLLAYLAAVLAFIAFILLVIGLPIFGRQSNALSRARGDANYNKRYGFWLIVPTIVLEFLAAILFLLAAFFYKKSGSGNIMTSTRRRAIFGGQQALGPPNMFIPPPAGSYPRMPLMGGDPMNSYSPLSPVNRSVVPSLLSEYLNNRQTIQPDVITLPPINVGSLPQPSIAQAVAPQVLPNVTPAYYRIGEPVGPRFTPIINLTGQTIVGPLMRTA